MPAMMNETMTLGPASGTAWDSTKKMPVPTVEPTPNMVSWNVPILRLRWSADPYATGAPTTGRRRSICSVRLIEVAGNSASLLLDQLIMQASRNAAANWSTAQSISCCGNHQRRREPQRRAVGVFHQHTALGQPQAHFLAGGQRRFDVDAGPQSEAAHRHHTVADQPPQPPMQMRAQFRRTELEFPPRQHGNHCSADRRGQRIAAERRAVFARMQHAEDLAVCDHGRQRNHAAAQRLAEQVDVRYDAPAVAGERVAGATPAPTGFRRRSSARCARCTAHGRPAGSRRAGR